VKSDKPEQAERDDGFVLSDPAMDAALNWFTALQGYPNDPRLRSDFEAWRAADPKNEAAYSEVAGVWDFEELDVIAADIGRMEGAQQYAQPARPTPSLQPHRSRWTSSIMAAAAVILVAVGVQQYPILMVQWRSDYQTVAGATENVTLPDGSKMTLNTSSAVAVDFEGGRRSVRLLQGEAYFDVVHDESRPFKVAAGYSEVVVKGTAFSVRTDSDEDMVILERGLVGVSRLSDKTDNAELHPGESITATASALSAVRPADTAIALSWRDGRLVFVDQPFEEVLSEIGRYYPHSIVVTNDRVAKAKVTGNYMLENPERIIRSLASTVGGNVTRIPGGIIILR
jgi:transmembrane sensor